MRLVIVESPYAGNVELNEAYARAALRDCLLRGEAPFASHLLYTLAMSGDMGGPSGMVLWKDPEYPGTDDITAAGIALAGRERRSGLHRTAALHGSDYRVVAAMRAGSQDG